MTGGLSFATRRLTVRELASQFVGLVACPGPMVARQALPVRLFRQCLGAPQ